MIEFLQTNWETIVAAASPVLIFLVPVFNFIKKNTKLEKLVDKLKNDLNVNQEDMSKILNAANALKEIGDQFKEDIISLYESKKDELVENVKIITDEVTLIVEKLNKEIKKNRIEANSVVQSFNDFILNLGIPEVREMIKNAKIDSLSEEAPQETDSV